MFNSRPFLFVKEDGGGIERVEFAVGVGDFVKANGIAGEMSFH